MNKFENVDIFASLDAIMRQNTGFFQSDFDTGNRERICFVRGCFLTPCST